MNEETRPYGDKVRIICKPAEHLSCNLLVQVKLADNWVLADIFNDLVDPNAVELADTLASSLQARYATSTRNNP